LQNITDLERTWFSGAIVKPSFQVPEQYIVLLRILLWNSREEKNERTAKKAKVGLFFTVFSSAAGSTAPLELLQGNLMEDIRLFPPIPRALKSHYEFGILQTFTKLSLKYKMKHIMKTKWTVASKYKSNLSL